MSKYIVKRAWHGVEKGSIVEMKTVHPALKANVEPLPDVKLEVATPKAKAPAKKA